MPSRLHPGTLLLQSSLFFPCGLYNTVCLSAGNGFFCSSSHSNHKFYPCLDPLTFLCPVSPARPFHSSCKSLVCAFTPHPSFSNKIHSNRKGLISSSPQQQVTVEANCSIMRGWQVSGSMQSEELLKIYIFRQYV